MPLRYCKISPRKAALTVAAVYILLFVCAAKAQYRFDSWTTDDGLPQNSVYSILQTRDGYIWLTTLDGLVRFDGVRFAVFNKSNTKNLPSNRLVELFAEADGGALWICTEEGALVRFSGGEFQTFTTADGLSSNRVFEVQQDADKSLLFFTDNGIVRFRDNRFTIESRRAFRDYKIYIAPSGRRWEMDAGGLRAIGPGGGETRYDLPFDRNKISSDPSFNYFSFVEMLETPDGALWFSAAGSLFKLENGATTAFTEKDGMPPSLVRSLAQDREGAIWLGTEKNGACRFAERRFACFDVRNGLSSNTIYDIFTDREGTLWIASNNKGFSRVTKQLVAPLSSAEGLADKNVYPILEDSRGAIWIGSFSALSKYETGKLINYARRDGLLYPIVQSLFEDCSGRLWIGSVGGVERLENGKFYDFTEKLNLPLGVYDFWDIHEDRSGTLWFATSKGLIKYDGATATILTTGNDLPGNDFKAILETRDGTLWLGTYGGLVRLKDGKFIRSTEQDGLAGNHVRALYEDASGTLWLGTYDAGLSRYKDGRFTNYTTENGLFSNGVFQILEDSSGNFWMSSNQGIYRVAKQQLNDFADGRISSVTSTAFGKSDGMLSAEANGGRQPAGIKTKDGRLWFPTQDGVAIIDPEAVAFNPLAPPVVIESVKIDNVFLSEPPALAGGLLAMENLPANAGGSDIVIQPGQNNLEIQYTGLSFIKPEQIRFRYKLEGLNDVWTEAGTRRAAFYPYLPPGSYTFRVVAANSDNVWNESGAAIKIVVRPPFYRTWLFLGICAAAIGLFAFAAYRVRVSRLEKARRAQEEFSRRLINAHESERRRIAAELHDSIGQSLAMIKNRLIFSRMKIADEETKEQLETIAAQTSQTINEVREISYNLRPYLLERLGLTQSIKSFLDEIADLQQLKIEAQIDDVGNLFTAEKEMSLYRIVQESLNNVVKHSEAKTVRVSIKKTSRMLTIVIEDDGKGFEPSSSGGADDNGRDKGGFGLIGMAERIRMLGGRHIIESTIGEGTKISIAINTDEEIKKTWREKSV